MWKNVRLRRLLIVLAVVLVLAGVAPFIARCILFDTEYAEGFSASQIKKVQTGAQLSSVLDVVGDPLHVLLMGSDDKESSRDWQLWKVGVQTVSTSGDFVLRYSAPVDGASYRANEVWFKNGRVAEIRSYDSWD